MAFDKGHAIVIGVGSHELKWLDVPVTVEDAKAVANVLKDPAYCGYPEGQVSFLHDGATTKAGILGAFDQLRAADDDTVFVFYAGHGALGEDSKYYLVSHDAKINQGRVVSGTGVSEEELLEKLRAIPAKRVLMVFNACHSGNLNPTLDVGDQALATSNPTSSSANKLLATGTGRIMIAACKEEEKSYIGSGNLTIFTQALVDGLKGKDIDSNGGYVSAYALYDHVYATVSETVRKKFDKSQEPELTVIKGVGPFAVSLYKGARTLGVFDETEAVPETPGVHEVPKEKIVKIQNTWNVNRSGDIKTSHQSGGINVTGGTISVGGDMVARDKIVQGDKINAQGSQGFVNRPSGFTNTGTMNVQGSQLAGGNISSSQNNQNVTRDDFDKIVKQLQAAVTNLPLSSADKAQVESDFADIQSQTQSPEPKQSRIQRRLEDIKEIVEGVADVGAAATPLLALIGQGLQMAGVLFK